jgi:UDP-N-acetylmuramoyl-tripeptide--D-alanyl-D-alanine ligase
MIASILEKIGSVLVTKDNFNNEIGVPTTLINISAIHDYAVVEMGARNEGDINYLCEIAKPDIALINNILPAHLESFGDIKNIAKAKGEIYKDLRNNGTAVINIDEPHAQAWIKSTNAKIITFSTHNIQADFSAQNITSKKEGHFNFSLVTPQGTIQINLPLRGKHNIANAVASAACAHTAGAKLQTIQDALNSLMQVEGRMECIKLSPDLFLIDDSYNASPGSVKAAIDTLIEINGASILILGDMAELGQDEIQLHAGIGKYAFDAGVDVFLAVGPLSFHAAKEFGVKSQHFNEKKELLNYLHDSKILNKDLPDIKKVILVKGSRYMGMEDISDSIKNRGVT